MRQYIYIRRDHSRYQSDQLDKVEDRIRSDGYWIERRPWQDDDLDDCLKILTYTVTDTRSVEEYYTTVSVYVEDQ